MSATLERIIEDSAKFYSPGLQLDLKNCTIIGKIIPADGQKGTVLRDIEFERYQKNGRSILLTPQVLQCGDYTFYFSIICSDDQIYEWYHNLKIVEE